MTLAHRSVIVYFKVDLLSYCELWSDVMMQCTPSHPLLFFVSVESNSEEIVLSMFWSFIFRIIIIWTFTFWAFTFWTFIFCTFFLLKKSSGKHTGCQTYPQKKGRQERNPLKKREKVVTEASISGSYCIDIVSGTLISYRSRSHWKTRPNWAR